jgi:sensor histidine kinase YesM
MISFLKKYKAFGIGIVITLILRVVLEYAGFLAIKGSLWLENIAYFTFWSVMFSLPIHYFTHINKNKKTAIRVVALIFLFFTSMVIDQSLYIPDNPITYILFTFLMIGFVYILSPSFIIKYWKLIVIIYCTLLLFFIYIRLFSGDIEAYKKIKDDVHLLFFLFPAPLIMGLLLWIYEQWKWLKSLKDGKAKAELDLLKTQINPHFFFNTLNNLYSLTVKQSEEAPKVVLKLSEMMRYTIYEGKKELVSLADEVEYLKNYIDLHKIRYRKTVDIQFDHEINQSQQIAPLMFIVPLENAIKHGVETLSDNAYIKMSLHSDDKTIRFTIENNFDPNEIGEEKGIGLENLKQRLALTYPKNHELSIVEENNVFKLTLSIDL